MQRRGGRRGWLVWPVVLALAGRPGGTTEPDGAFALRYAWDDPSHLQVTIQARTPVDEVVVTWSGPPGIVLKAGTSALAGGGERLALGHLEGRTTQVVRLEVERGVAAGAGPIGVVRVEAVLRGHPVREALGIPLTEGPQGRLRAGALEFDAAPEPHR